MGEGIHSLLTCIWYGRCYGVGHWIRRLRGRFGLLHCLCRHLG
jgi:hypothetical protein